MGWVDSCSRRFWTRGAARNTALQRTKFNPFRVRAFVLRVLRLWISSRIYIYIIVRGGWTGAMGVAIYPCQQL